MICKAGALSFLILFITLSAGSQSVQKVTRITGGTPAAAAPVELTARCISCATTIEGHVEVSRDGIAFCCTGIEKNSHLVTAECPYSFRLPAASIAQQFIETSGGSTIWHVITTSKIHYAFSSSDDTELGAGFEALRSASKRILSEKELKKISSLLASTRTPKLIPGQCGR